MEPEPGQSPTESEISPIEPAPVEPEQPEQAPVESETMAAEPEKEPTLQFPLDLLIVIIFTLLGAVFAFIMPDGNFLRVIFGIPLIIFFPGYALVSVLWPSKKLANIERLALAIGFSIAISALGGTALAYANSMSLAAIVGLLLVIIIALVGLAYWQRSRLPDDEVYVFAFPKPGLAMPKGKPEMFLVIVLASCLIVSGIAMGYLLTQPVEGEPYTELYILDVNGTANDYPVNLTVNQVGQVIVGVACHELEATEYDIIFGLAGAGDTGLNSTWDSPQQLNGQPLTHRAILLSPEDVFEDNCTFRFSMPGTYEVSWALVIDGQETDYEVHLWIEVH